MLTIAQVLKEKCFKNHGFADSQTTNKLVNEAANNSARVNGQDRRILPALRTNDIAAIKALDRRRLIRPGKFTLQNLANKSGCDCKPTFYIIYT